MAVNLEEYFRKTFEDKLLVNMPEREDDHLTPATRLLEKRREMAEVEQALGAQKEEFQMKMESLQQRREELERKVSGWGPSGRRSKYLLVFWLFL